jgi:hypothetical protein
MKINKGIGLLLLVFAGYTILCMALDKGTFWRIYNYVTLVFSVSSGIILLKQK